jgi:hypothetical protein
MAAAALWLTGCNGGAEDLLPFEINFSFDISPIGGCASSQCTSYGMACDTVVQVRITDAQTGDVIDTLCDQVVGDNACNLFAVNGGGSFLSLPPRMVRIQVAAWRREVLANDSALSVGCIPDDEGEDFCCPADDIFDLQGVPLSTFSPQPAFGGAAYFDITSDNSSVTIPLACPDPEQLNDPAECQLPDALVTAIVDDMENLVDRLTEEQARALFDISATEPRPQSDGDGNTFFVIQAGDKVPLALKEPIEATPSFQAFSSRRFGNVACVTILESGGGAETLSTCQNVVQPDPMVLSLFGHFLERDAVDQIKLALGLPALPDDGLIIGRVVDHEGAALAGVRVDSVLVDADVQYLNSDRTAPIGVETSSSAFFVSTDAPFNTQWTALHNDGRREDGEYRAGLIEGNVTLLLIQMEPPP